MHQYLLRVGLVEEDLNQLNAIHVAGTKGKVYLAVALVHVPSSTATQCTGMQLRRVLFVHCVRVF